MGDSKLLELSSDRLSLSHSDGNSLADEEREREREGGEWRAWEMEGSKAERKAANEITDQK